MIGAVVNATVSAAPIARVQVTGAEFGCYIGHCPRGFPEPLPLTNGHFLYLYNALGLRRKERYLATLEYRYWYQATADSNSWIFRYEYLRDPPAWVSVRSLSCARECKAGDVHRSKAISRSASPCGGTGHG